MGKKALFLSILLTLVVTTASFAAVDLGSSAETGRLELQSIGALAFGPDGILFAADSMAASVYAIDTGDSHEVSDAAAADTQSIDKKIAAALGASVDQIRILDMAVNPISKNVYLSVTRGQGEDAAHVLIRVLAGDTIELVDLEYVHYSKATLPNPPDPTAERRGQSLRLETITDLGYADGNLFVTGLSNEEFSSKLRNLKFPFTDVDGGTSIDIFHGAHGRWETYAPVRTFALYYLGTAPHILAAYTCTPLVRFKVADLVSGSEKLQGTTVAELGNRNRPLDMVVYEKNGKDYVLMANSARGVMKVELASITQVTPITDRIADTAGLPYETLTELQGVQQLDRFDDSRALLLVQDSSGLNLQTIALP